MTSLVALFSYQIKFNVSTSKTVTKIVLKKLYFNVIVILWGQISFHEHFKQSFIKFFVRLNGVYNTNLAVEKHHVNLLLQ